MTVPRVPLSPTDIDAAYNIAKARGKRFPNNPFDFDFAGARGEIALQLWAASVGIATVDPAFRDPNRDAEADLYLGSGRLSIDVKTSFVGSDRAYPEVQVKRLARKALVVVWCDDVAHFEGYDEKPASAEVKIAGWSRSAAIFSARPVPRHEGKYEVREIHPKCILPIELLLACI